MKDLNKTVAKFTYRGRRYEVDMLLDTKWGGEAGTPQYIFDIFDVTRKKEVECIGQFDGDENADHKELAKEYIKSKEEK